MNKQARKEQAIKYLQQLDIYKPYIRFISSVYALAKLMKKPTAKASS